MAGDPGRPCLQRSSLLSRPVEETLLTSRSHKCPGMSDPPDALQYGWPLSSLSFAAHFGVKELCWGI